MNNNTNVYNIFSSIADNYDRLNTILTLNQEIKLPTITLGIQ
ncbi:class I SAM-dependent methyltransferase [Clostridium sp. WILCCON 0269]|uniref:Class I SAM-dependent methyltransferase n=1 Tax=Candidatus Clostridium eludens TaxID=3381663 RepID=A0ABW8SFJ5_9CLOT